MKKKRTLREALMIEKEKNRKAKALAERIVRVLK